MIVEIATMKIKAGQRQAFEAVWLRAESIISAAKGYVSHEMRRCIETPDKYQLLARWQTVEAHTVDFRQSEAYKTFRGMIGEFFAEAPQVEHFEAVSSHRL
ncbi:MAG: antibiotic biosynthesis monooxygenase [Betaproteobacteria bacterium]|nr:antibiotic biosynthesis monooxygenase [Betaproteobacteria bacterium]